MVTTTPAVVVSAPSSGSGKTTIATGLMGALRRAGHRVAPFKVGPDFIDPGYHAVATGRPGRNLDPVLVGEDLIGGLYRHGSQDADIAVIEGVMGLFDGRIEERFASPPRGSTAQVAQLLGAPVVLVLDGRGQGHSAAALLAGFAGFDHRVRIGGVILNRVASARHDTVLRQACDAAGLPVLGALPRDEALSVPSRHLGLVTAEEHRQAGDAVAAMTDAVARHVDVAAVAALAAARVPEPAWSPRDAVGESVAGRPVVAVATGPAFTFRYAEHDELLRAAGAEPVGFDPCSDLLPDGAAAVVLPGGFPEQYPEALTANTGLRDQIRRAVAHGSPVHAECGGLTYLMDDLDGHPMCGVLPGSARFTPRLTLGYRDAVAAVDSAMFDTGARIVGHEFHRTAVEFARPVRSAWWLPGDGKACGEGAVTDGVHASYLHTHPAAAPQAVRRLVAHAAEGGPASGFRR